MDECFFLKIIYVGLAVSFTAFVLPSCFFFDYLQIVRKGEYVPWWAFIVSKELGGHFSLPD